MHNFHSSPGSYWILCQDEGGADSDIQFYNNTIPFTIAEGVAYQLSFWARASTPIDTIAFNLMRQDNPWDHYSQTVTVPCLITENWQPYEVGLLAIGSSDHARVNFWLGRYLPAGDTLYVDDITLCPWMAGGLVEDVGNLIFAGGTLGCGRRVRYAGQLNSQGCFFYYL